MTEINCKHSIYCPSAIDQACPLIAKYKGMEDFKAEDCNTGKWYESKCGMVDLTDTFSYYQKMVNRRT